jgi:NAD(P)-dependent dehydrogenase (short-subunit alcohol dehydrogenase family)
MTRQLAVVTGASSGIGRATAIRLSSDGLHVLCCDLAPKPRSAASSGVEPTDALATRLGGSAEFVMCDVQRERDVERLAARIRELDSPLQAAVVNAGIFPGARLILEEEIKDHEAVMAVNEQGAWLTCRMAARVMAEQGTHGSIVFIASVVGLVGEVGASSYCASKGAVIGMMRAIALELAPLGIRVNAVCPGWVDTPLNEPHFADAVMKEEALSLHPLGRFGRPEDVAAAVTFLSSGDSDWITGVALPVDGGYSCR